MNDDSHTCDSSPNCDFTELSNSQNCFECIHIPHFYRSSPSVFVMLSTKRPLEDSHGVSCKRKKTDDATMCIEDEGCDGIMRLPNELLQHVAMHMDTRALFHMSLVNKTWRSVIVSINPNDLPLSVEFKRFFAHEKLTNIQLIGLRHNMITKDNAMYLAVRHVFCIWNRTHITISNTA